MVQDNLVNHSLPTHVGKASLKPSPKIYTLGSLTIARHGLSLVRCNYPELSMNFIYIRKSMLYEEALQICWSKDNNYLKLIFHFTPSSTLLFCRLYPTEKARLSYMINSSSGVKEVIEVSFPPNPNPANTFTLAV